MFHLIQKTKANVLVTNAANVRRSQTAATVSQSFCVILLALTVWFVFSPVLCRAESFTFVPRSNVLIGGGPLSVTVADFDADGNQDFAEGSPGNAVVVVYYGKGNGRFRPSVSFPANSYPYELAAADLNADGYPDLVVNNFNTISILLNDKAGGFGAPVIFTADGSPRGIGIGDFNGDGNLDLAIGNEANDDVSILLGNGTGNFGLPTNFPAGDQPESVAVGDFNEDGILDLAVSAYISTNVVILQGDGAGGFTYKNSYPLAGNAAEVVVGDFNNDQHLDFAVGYYNADNHIVTFLGNGLGAFTSGGAVPVGDVHGLTAADFNLDGNLDLAGATYFGEGVMVAVGDGTGHFNAKKFSLTGRQPLPYDVAAADFDGDGRPDLVTANYGNGTASLLFNTLP